MLETTLLYLILDDKVMLANKKRGFGVNKINGTITSAQHESYLTKQSGVGGKFSLETDKTIDDTCVRECEEECGAKPKSIQRRGTIDFFYQNRPHWDNRCAIYTSTEWMGELVETEEMKPDWFEIAKIPYDRMWPDDEIWLPLILNSKDSEVYFKFWFTEDGKIIEYKQFSKEEWK